MRVAVCEAGIDRRALQSRAVEVVLDPECSGIRRHRRGELD